MYKTCIGSLTFLCAKKQPCPKFAVMLTSMGLTGVDGRGWRYSGCKMCPARAVSIFSTLMGRRPAWRKGSDGETQWWTDSRLMFVAPFSPTEEPLSHAGFVLFLRTDTKGDVIMTRFSYKWSEKTCGDQRKPAVRIVLMLIRASPRKNANK